MAPKRDLESEDSDVASPEQKRPRRLPSFASIIADAMKIQNLQKLLEPLIRRVVSEEIERAVARLVPAKLRSTIAYTHKNRKPHGPIYVSNNRKPG